MFTIYTWRSCAINKRDKKLCFVQFHANYSVNTALMKNRMYHKFLYYSILLLLFQFLLFAFTFSLYIYLFCTFDYSPASLHISIYPVVFHIHDNQCACFYRYYAAVLENVERLLNNNTITYTSL